MADGLKQVCPFCSLQAAQCPEGQKLFAEVCRVYAQLRSAVLPLPESLWQTYERVRAAYFVHCGL